MEILKWYSIILIGLGVLSNLYLGIKNKGTTKIVSFIILIPVLVYLILKR